MNWFCSVENHVLRLDLEMDNCESGFRCMKLTDCFYFSNLVLCALIHCAKELESCFFFCYIIECWDLWLICKVIKVILWIRIELDWSVFVQTYHNPPFNVVDWQGFFWEDLGFSSSAKLIFCLVGWFTKLVSLSYYGLIFSFSCCTMAVWIKGVI